jgi:hypothetical protein
MSYTSRLLNYVEPYYIDGIAKTAFWTEVNCNLQKNDKVFIINGFYDSEIFIRKGKWTKNADGYRVLLVDRCKVVLDIEWESGQFAGLTQTYKVDNFDNYLKLYNIRSQREFDYINKIKIDSYSASRYSKFELNLTNNLIYSDRTWLGVTGLGANSGIDTTKSVWARAGNNWVNLTSEFINNTFTFSQDYLNVGLTNNGRIYVIGEDINYANLLLKERNIYKWTGSASWVIDTEYKQPILSKLYFKQGVFKGTHNDGVFGNYSKLEIWSGTPSIWNSGYFVNSVWQSGQMKSKSTVYEPSYYSTLVNGKPVQTTDFSNNKGYGYNFIVDSDIKSATIDNGNFFNTNIGQYDTGLTAIDDYFGLTNSYQITLNGGFYNYCDINNTKLNDATTLDSIIKNSSMTETRTFNSQILESYSTGGEFSVTEGSINVLGADLASYITSSTSLTYSSIRSILKLYIADGDIHRLDNLDSFYITKLNKEWILTRLDADFKVYLPLESKYILDTFYDFKVNLIDQECIASLKSKSDNKYSTIVDFNGTTYSNTSTLNTRNFASIDLDLSNYLAFYRYQGNFVFLNQTYLDKNVVDNVFRGTSITNSDFRDGVIKNTLWTSGSHQNYPSNRIAWQNDALNITKYSTDEIQIGLSSSRPTINDNLFRKGTYVWLDSIQHSDGVTTTSLNDVYTVSTFSSNSLILKSTNLTGVSSSGTYSVVGGKKPQYISVHKLLIEDSVIRKGLFVRNLFKNSTFRDSDFNSNDRSLDNSNISKARVINHYFGSGSSSNTIESGLFHNSHFISDVNWISGIADNSVWDGPEFKGGIFNYGIWLNGTFSGGVFQNSRGLTYSIEDYTAENNYYRNWSNGTFNGGEFFNSVWLNGTFNLGKFWSSDWYGGVWNNGILGDRNIPTSRTTMAKLLNIGTGATQTFWYNGMVEGAEVGGEGYIDWFDGKFNAGIFSASTDGTHSIWYNGQFNGGNFTGLSRWKNGSFNGGKFTSWYGWTLSSSSQSTDYAWEYGEFKGGQFGEESLGTNSTWFDGQFLGGIFKGRVWNKGIFLNGAFEGSGTNSVLTNTGSFSESFTQSYWGLWRSGTVTDQKHKADPSFVVPVNSSIVGSIPADVNATIKNTIWVEGNFNHPAGEIINSAWLKGKFIAGKFTDGVFNPYIKRDWWDTTAGTYSTFNFDLANCVWQNGQFKGLFYISDWLDGEFLGGTMSGARWFNGTWKFGNASNMFWENGTWKNGNWDGSPFDLSTLTLTQSEHRMNEGMQRDILLRVANIHQDGKIHVINAFTGSYSENLFEGWTFSDTSAELANWLTSGSTYYLDYGQASTPGIVVIDNQFNTPSLANTTTVAVTGTVTENDEYRVYIYDGYISVTASSTDTLSTIADKLVDQINLGVFRAVVKFEQWTANGYVTNLLTWRQVDGKFESSLPYAEATSGGQFFVQSPLDTYTVVQAFSGFQGSSIYKQSERLYAMIDDGAGLTTSVFTQSAVGVQHNIILNVYNFFGRTDFVVSIQGNVFRETILTTGPRTLNYSLEPESGGDVTLFVERVLYEEPDNSSFEVQDLQIIRLEASYDTINNTLYQFGTYSEPFQYGSTGSTVSLPERLLTGFVTNNEAVSIKYGNGAFKYGLWENGYWNNGWHASWNSEREYFLFKDVILGGFAEASTNLWIINLSALTNTNGLEIGQRVSIGNIVFIDINEQRRLIRGWYRIINKTITTITVEINVNFAVRRIERDSLLHLIYVSKNIWQSGIFHNGYFKGIWNYGLFRGYPYVTKMDQSHWIDGIFDGGHFLSTKSYYTDQGVSQSYNNGLIQNFIFRDNNVARSSGAYEYNSWVDTNYFTYSMTNLLKDTLRYDSDWGVVLSSGNLKGYPSEDVLSSSSIFRNSFDTNIKYYSLGIKYKTYVDYIKAGSFFTYPLNSNGAPGVTDFISYGWTYTANFINLHSNASSADDNVLQIDYSQEIYNSIGVKLVQTDKLLYSNQNIHISERSLDGFGSIRGDFSSGQLFSVVIGNTTQPAGTRFSKLSYQYQNWPLRPELSGVQKLSTDIVGRVNALAYTSVNVGDQINSDYNIIGDTEASWRRVYMLDLFNPSSTDAIYGGYDRAGDVPNNIVVIADNTSNVGDSSNWSYTKYVAAKKTRLKFNAFIPFKFFATENDTGTGLRNRLGWSVFKLIGVIEKLAKLAPGVNPTESDWKYVTSTEFNFYPNSAFGTVDSAGRKLNGFAVDKVNSTFFFDNTTNPNESLRGFLKIDGYELDVETNDNFRFRLYWIDVRKMFASDNQTGYGAPGYMTLQFGKDADIPYTENNHGYFEIIDMSTYVNQNTNLLDNIKTKDIERFRYSVVDFDIKSTPQVTTQGTASSLPDTLPNIFLLNSDYDKLPGSFSAVINHGLTTGNKKEYFYNRKSLNLFFKSVETFSVQFSKIQFYETDMIPFFRYTDESAVNQDPQSPYYGSAPVEGIAEGSLSLDTISYTSPFAGNVPIRGQVIVPGGAGSTSPGGTTPGGETPPSSNVYTIQYFFVNNTISGINEFTSYYKIEEYNTSNVLVKTVDYDLFTEANYNGSFTITQGNRLEIFIVATYSGVVQENRVSYVITRDDLVQDANFETDPALDISSTSYSYTPTRNVTVYLSADPWQTTYYYQCREYDCVFGESGPIRIIKAYYSIPTGYYACSNGQLYIIGAEVPKPDPDTSIGEVNSYGPDCIDVATDCG